MKILVVLAVTFSLCSCNTSIGVWRDTKALAKWSQRKIQESNANANANANANGGVAEQDYEYGAPVY